MSNTKHGVLSRLGFFINKQLLNTRVLAGSIAAVALTSISTVFNYQFGAMLAGEDAISQTLLPIGYASLDVGALFIGGYLGLVAKQYFSKIIGLGWLCVLICMSLFTAWSFQCATDHAKLSTSTLLHIEGVKADINRYQSQYNQSIKEKNNTRYHNHKERYQAEADNANLQLEQKKAELMQLESKNVPPEYAVFYRTPILNKAPEQNITIVRFVFSSAIIFTPFVILYLMGIESGTEKDEKQTATRKVKTADISTVLDKTSSGESGAKNHGSSAASSGANSLENLIKELEQNKDFKQQYSRLKKLIASGKIKPSYRQIETKGGIGSKYTKAILHKLEQEQITVKNGQGWKLNPDKKSLVLSETPTTNSNTKTTQEQSTFNNDNVVQFSETGAT